MRRILATLGAGAASLALILGASAGTANAAPQGSIFSTVDTVNY